MKAVAKGQLKHWKKDKDGRLAMLILCDQYPRNVFRGSIKTFMFDAIANAIAKKILALPSLYKQYNY